MLSLHQDLIWNQSFLPLEQDTQTKYIPFQVHIQVSMLI